MDMAKGHTALILDVCREHKLLRNQAAYVLATALWETAHTMEPVVEAYWTSESWRKRNLRYYPWHGRGFVQLTWEENYQRAAKELGRPIDKKPEMALEPRIAAEILVVGMKKGWFTGKQLSDYVTLQASDFRNARRIVNGTDKAQEIAKLAYEYNSALIELGYGVTDARKPSNAVSQPTQDESEHTGKSGGPVAIAATAILATLAAAWAWATDIFCSIPIIQHICGG